MACSVDGCGRRICTQGLCAAHIYRLRKYGSVGTDPISNKTPNGALVAFLRAHKDHEGADCLPWPFGKHTNGYGGLRFKGVHMAASRAMCLIAHGEPPTPDHEAAHSCGHGDDACVHQGHLRWATTIENQHDRLAHGTDVRGEKHHAAELTESQVRQLRREMIGRSKKYKAVADELGVTPSTIRRAVLGITWSHI